MKRPRLFLDVDGVFLAIYGGVFQLRPYAGTFLQWANEHFDMFWLTCHGPRSTNEIAFLCSFGQITDPESYLAGDTISRVARRAIGYADWEPDGKRTRLDKLQGVIDNGGLDGEWFVLEDEYPMDGAVSFLREKDLLQRWVICPPTGADVLLEAMYYFQELKDNKWDQKKVRPPWRNVNERIAV